MPTILLGLPEVKTYQGKIAVPNAAKVPALTKVLREVFINLSY